MGRTGPVGATLVAALSTGGCADLMTGLRDGGAGATTGAIQRRPAEDVDVTYVPGVGLVRGTRPALAGLAAPLRPARGLNRAVAACREAVQAEAGKLGARSVEAVSAGPEQRNPQGQTVGPVRVRITYERVGGYEVREATMRCVVDRSGKVVGTTT
jgi:hypothetical protein